MQEKHFGNALVAGGCAGFSVDLALFPLDTVKTRLQSSQGFWKSGGFRGIYSGLPSAAVGSVPNAALFFCTYETVKKLLCPFTKDSSAVQASSHMVAASCGEVVACLVRVPCEVIKQRAQAAPHLTTLHVLRSTWKAEGLTGMYRGYFGTVVREIPFSLIQFPLWEYLKVSWSRHQGFAVEPWQSSVAGAVAGGIAAGLTTPLDVAKTRIMLAQAGSVEAKGKVFQTMSIVFTEKGVQGLFAGLLPRVAWISLGGAIFLGIYEKVNRTLCS